MHPFGYICVLCVYLSCYLCNLSYVSENLQFLLSLMLEIIICNKIILNPIQFSV